MAVTEPKAKKNCKLKHNQSLPVIENGGELYRFKGTFNGLCVVIDDEEDMKTIISMGYFGKATLSRNYPGFRKFSPEILRDRVFQNRKRNSGRTNAPQKIIVVPDSDSEAEDLTEYFTNLKPHYQLDCSGITETVNLGLEEAFFLVAAVNCLDIRHEGRILGVDEIWGLFQESDMWFLINYVAYYYFRTKNWVVKPGIKFGGDFLLYKQGPPFYHASYVVIIHVVDENLSKIEHLNRRSMSNLCLLGLNRLCETAGKELLICEIIWPGSLQHNQVRYQDLSNFTIKETVMKRWIFSLKKQPQATTSTKT